MQFTYSLTLTDLKLAFGFVKLDLTFLSDQLSIMPVLKKVDPFVKVTSPLTTPVTLGDNVLLRCGRDATRGCFGVAKGVAYTAHNHIGITTIFA